MRATNSTKYAGLRISLSLLGVSFVAFFLAILSHAQVADQNGNSNTNSNSNSSANSNTNIPTSTLTWLAPSDRGTISGTFTLKSSTTDPTLQTVNFTYVLADGEIKLIAAGQQDTSGVWYFDWDTTALSDGDYELRAYPGDTTTVYSAITITIANGSSATPPSDVTPPPASPPSGIFPLPLPLPVPLPLPEPPTPTPEPVIIPPVLPPPPPPTEIIPTPVPLPLPLPLPIPETPPTPPVTPPPAVAQNIITWLSPKDGDIVFGLVHLNVTLSNFSDQTVTITKIDTNGSEVLIGTAVYESSSHSWRLDWDTLQETNGKYALRARVKDNAPEVIGDIRVDVENEAVPVNTNTNIAVNSPAPVPLIQVLPTDCQKLGITSLEECKKLVTSTAEQNKTVGVDETKLIIKTDVVPSVGKQLILPERTATPTPSATPSGTRPPPTVNQPSSGTNQPTSTQGNTVQPAAKPDLGEINKILPIELPKTVSTLVFPSIENEIVISDVTIYVPPVVIGLDSDGDGLTDDQEKRFGTDPTKSDTDGDGFSDYVEIQTGYNPLGPGYKPANLSPADQAIVNRATLEQPKFGGQTDSQHLTVASVTNVVTSPGTGQPQGIVFDGKTSPNATLLLFIYSPLPMVITVQADDNGDYKYILDQPLKDGVHQAYVTVTDKTGKIQSKSDPLSFFIKGAQAVSEDQFFRPDVNVTTSSETSINYYILGAIGLVVLASMFVIGVYWKKIKNISTNL